MNKQSFNPQARWDRNIPQSDTNPDLDTLNEPIEVLALFKRGKIFPRGFLWKNKKYVVKEITYNWQERLGSEIINYFSVNTDANLYQISFHNITNGWKIDKIIS